MKQEMFERAGIQLTHDSLDIEHIRFSSENRIRSRRFDEFRQSFFSLPSGAAGTRAAVLCLFELVPAEQLESACASTISVLGCNTYCDWYFNNQLHRRALTDLSITLLTKSTPVTSNDVSLFLDWASKDAYKCLPFTSLLSEIALDQLAWSARNLSPVMWSHVAGLRSMTTIPFTYLRRESTNLAPPIALDSDDVSLEADRDIFMDYFDDVQGDDSDDKLIQNALDELAVDGNQSEKENLRVWLRKLLSKQELALKKGPVSYLILCWMIDLIESGTFNKTNADIKTRQRYCKVLAITLFRTLKTIEKPPSAWTSADIEASFVTIMSTVAKDKRATSAALLSFTHFAHEIFGLPLVLLQSETYLDAPLVRAQLVTQTEILRALDWIDPAQGDVALNLMIRALLALGYAAPFRLRELLYLRKANIAQLSDGSFEIEIVPLLGKNKLKTPAAKRWVFVDVAFAMEALQKLIEFRAAQGWSANDLLFGPSAPSGDVYRRHALYRALLTILKVTTGDPSMTFHALRHSYASRYFKEILKQPECILFNGLTQLAEYMGHVSVTTTLTYYIHEYESVLRSHLQRVNSITLNFDSNVAGRLLGCSPSAFRKKVERKNLSAAEVLLDELSASVLKHQLALAPTDEGWDTPAAPKLPTGFVNVLNPYKVLNVLQSLDAPNIDVNLVAAQSRLEPQIVKAIQQSTVDLAIATNRPRHGRPSTTPPTNTRTALAALSMNVSASSNVKFTATVKALEKVQINSDLKLALRYWLDGRRPNYIGIHQSNERLAFFRLLKSLNFQANHLLINVHKSKNSMDSILEIADLTRQFQSVFGLSPVFEEAREPHPKRPKTYLLIAGSKSSSAGNSASGLEAMLLALLIYVQQEGKQNA